MSSTESRRVDSVLVVTKGRHVFTLPIVLLASIAWSARAHAQQQPQGFAVERFYPSPPGSGWFLMDDLDMQGDLGGAVTVASGYAHNPLVVTPPDGTQRFSLVSDEVFVDFGLAATYHRYRVSLNFPMPLVVTGTSGTFGPYQLTAPSVNVGTNPDVISDARLGFDVRLLGEPAGAFRLGVGAQLLIPFGIRDDYVTDGTYRGMFRGLVAGDIGCFSYAGQLGLHVRPLDDSPVPGGPQGNELLFGVSVGRRISMGSARTVVVGPEFYGETATRSTVGEATGFEGLLTVRLEGTGDQHLRVKLGAGGGLAPHFGAPDFRIVVGVELVGRRSEP
jgi:hypothetical protein